MKKYLLGLFCLLILVSSLFVVVNKASALTSADIDMLVALGIISPDKADSAKAILFPVSTPTTPVVPPVVACKDILSRDLIVGSSDTRTLKDVSALQKFLGLNVTGYFGALTKSAVMKFQLENGVSPANGNVYSITRKFINEKNCKNTGQPIITSLSVNSGGPGTQVVIYGSNLYSSVAPYGVTFNDPTHDNGVSGTASTDGNSFTFIVPGSVSSGIGAGVYTITLENTLGQRSNSVSFTVTTSPQPTITKLGTSNALAGEKVAAYISNLPTNASMYSIVFSGSQAGDSTAILSPDRTYLAFTVPSLAPGNYSISAMFQTSTGEQIAVSNSVPFIIGSTSTPPSITVLSPNGGETWQTGTTQTIKWQDSMTYPTFAPVSYDIKLATYCGGQVCVAIAPYTIVKSVTGSSYSWGVGKTIDFFGTLVPDGAYTIQVCQTGTNTCDSSDSYFKITSAITQPTATVNGSPILKLTYDSQQRESKLTAIFEGTITTGNQTTYIYQNSAYILFTNQTGMTGVNTTIYGSGIITPLSSLDSVTDQWGRILYVLPANQTIKFTITSNSNPKIMFAGSYVASLQNINGTYTINSTDINISVPTNKTNNKTIIGELSPYITSVTQNLKVGDLMTIYGSRLNENGSTDRVYIDGVAITIDGWKGGGTSIGFNLPNLTAGQHNIQISNTYGMSNIIYFTVTGSTQTQPSITSITPSQGSAGTVLTIIGSNLSGATTIEFYSDSGQMMGSFAPSFSSVSSASLTFPIHGLFAANMTPGFYQVGVVTNTCAGGCNSNRIGFTFTAPATTPSITVISPNGGEIIDISKPVTVVLKSTNPYPAKHYINLLDETTAKSYSLDSLLGSSGLIFTDEQISQGRQSVVFNIPSSYNLSPSAKYKIEVCVNNICDKSDNYFSISAPTTVVNGTCGSANGVAVSSAPTANLCSSNIVTISTIGGTGPWTWSCSGINGGTTTSCSAPVIPPVVVSDDKYCKPTGGTWSSGCGSKSAQVAQAGVVLASGETIDLIKITKYVSSLIAKWGAHTVTCPANTNYRVCVENGNDGAGNYILLGVKVAQLNYNYSSPIINSNTQSNLNSVNVATILESVDLNDLINLLKLIK